MEAKKDRALGSGVGLEEKEDNKAGKTVEGTAQCLSCQKYMCLGEVAFCFTRPGGFSAAAEIIGWVPGKCDQYLKI